MLPRDIFTYYTGGVDSPGPRSDLHRWCHGEISPGHEKEKKSWKSHACLVVHFVSNFRPKYTPRSD